MPEFTYSGDPHDSERDRLRFVVGDTEENGMMLNDAEIDYMLEMNSSFERAVVDALERIVYKVAKDVYSQLGPSQEHAQQKFDHYKQLLEERKADLGSHRVMPFAGGIYRHKRATRANDSSLTQPVFKREADNQNDPRP